MSSNQSGEGDIRKAIIEADLVDCMVALPTQLFYSTQIPACLWFLTRDKKNSSYRDRRGETLFIDTRNMGSLIDRVHREFTEEDIAHIAETYHSWRGDKDCAKAYEDVPGFCKSVELDVIHKQGHILTPGRYVGIGEIDDESEPFNEKMEQLIKALNQQTQEAIRLDQVIRTNLEEMNYGG